MLYKEQGLKTAKEKKQIIKRDTYNSSQRDFQQKTWRPGEKIQIFTILKENYCQRTLHKAQILFRNKGEIKIFPEKQKLKEYISARLVLP